MTEAPPLVEATTPFWVSAFLDLEASVFDEAVGFWSGVTGYQRSPLRGDHDEFATLVPPDGDDFLRVQRLRDGGSRVHLDLHVPDPQAAADRAVALEATLVERSPHGYVVMASPGGVTFCFVSHPASARPAPAVWPTGSSILDQVAIDVPAEHAPLELPFWEQVTGWSPQNSRGGREFAPLRRPPGQPLRFLRHVLGDSRGPVRLHLDLATSDRAVETRRHEDLGGVVVRRFDGWTVMRDPAGLVYCLTDRDPEAGERR